MVVLSALGNLIVEKLVKPYYINIVLVLRLLSITSASVMSFELILSDLESLPSNILMLLLSLAGNDEDGTVDLLGTRGTIDFR